MPGKTDGRDRDDGDDGQSRERLGRMFGRLDRDFQVFKAQAGKNAHLNSLVHVRLRQQEAGRQFFIELFGLFGFLVVGARLLTEETALLGKGVRRAGDTFSSSTLAMFASSTSWLTATVSC